MHTNCAKCDRPLRGKRAKATGYGEHCRRRVYRAMRVLAESGNPVAFKAAMILYQANIRVIKPGRVWRIAGSTGVYMASANTCNCRGAIYRPTANTCAHSVAGAVLSV